ncbi:GLPGLI family protein [Thermonema rossianum]|uniref:GLPGLI family protein n=1 Tax=Thermonema rossianum TaxID=55505 RepID=UPI00057167D4|nr:GLPGLI family protein [Thermonema rossianum]
MKKLYLLVIALFFVRVVSAQIAVDTAQWHIDYAFEHKADSAEATFSRYEVMRLEVGRRVSKFYSLDYEACVEKKRSATPAMILANPGEYRCTASPWILFTNYPQAGSYTWQNEVLTNAIGYSEEMEVPQWTITNERKQLAIADSSRLLPCQKATTFYRGRHWEVWFTTALPLPEGPWKLKGLPGLVVEAGDSKHNFRFSLLKVSPVKDKAEAITYSELTPFERKPYRMMPYEEYAEQEQRISTDVEYALNSGIGITSDQIQIGTPDGERLSLKEYVKKYHKQASYNPLELFYVNKKQKNR